MNKGFKAVLVCVFLGFSFSFNFEKSFAGPDQGVEFSTIIDAFYSTLRTVKNLNYYTDEKVVFVVAGQEISFDIGAGHGNLFIPLKSVVAKLNTLSNGFGFSDSDEASLSDFAKVFIENEIYKNGKDVEVLKWFIDFKLNPMQLFTFKFLILLNSARVDGDYARMMEEVFCLLFRLSQVDDLDLIDKNKRLSEFLPESLVAALKDNNFGLVDFVDELWALLVNGKSSGQVVTKQAQMNGFVFKDEAIAKQVYEQFKSVVPADLYQQIREFIKPHGYGVVAMNDFVKFRSDAFSQNKFAKTLVGYEEFILTQNSDKPADLVAQVQALQNKTGLIMASDTVHGEYWVVYVSDDMSFVNVLKEVLLVIAGSFKEYLQAKKDMVTGFDDESLKYKAAFEARERVKIELEKYVRFEEGGPIFDQIKQGVQLLVDTDVKESQVSQSLQESIAALESDLNKLENSKVNLAKDLAKWQQVSDLPHGKNLDDVKNKKGQIKLELMIIDSQISEKQAAIAQTKAKLNKDDKVDAAAIEQDRKKLAKLYDLLEKTQRNGSVPSDKLLNAIKVIEARVAKIHVEQPGVKVSVDEKIVAREAVATLLENKINELKSQENAKLKEIDIIEDLEEKVIQELLLDDVIHMQKTFIKQLELTVAQIREDNEKAKKLEAYRKAFACVGADKISQEKMAEVAKLELEVGHILDSKKHEDFVSKIMLRDSLVGEFVKDLTFSSDRFMCVKARLQNSLSQVVNSSSHFKNNAKVYKYFWRTMPVSWKLFLGCVGVTEQTFC